MLIWFIIPYERRDMEMPINDIASTLQKYLTHIKGRHLDQAVIVFNCVPFHNGNSSV